MRAEKSGADFILLDSPGGGTGNKFDWSLVKDVDKKIFLAGGLNEENVCEAIKTLSPYAVDVSSGIETEGEKDEAKMRAFVCKVRNIKTDY